MFMAWYVVHYTEKRAGARIAHLHMTYVPVGAALGFLYTCAWYDTLMLIAKGWKITRRSVEGAEKWKMYGAIAFHAVSEALVLIMDTDTIAASVSAVEEGTGAGGAAQRVLWMSMLAYVISYVFLLWFVWFSADRQIMAVQFQLHMISDMGISPRSTPVWTRLKMFQNFRNAFLAPVRRKPNRKIYVCISRDTTRNS